MTAYLDTQHSPSISIDGQYLESGSEYEFRSWFVESSSDEDFTISITHQLSRPIPIFPFVDVVEGTSPPIYTQISNIIRANPRCDVNDIEYAWEFTTENIFNLDNLKYPGVDTWLQFPECSFEYGEEYTLDLVSTLGSEEERLEVSL